mmetsp:Transcript_55653/g.129579  ORF Transcript_55653/g.129579 Transcript_55653/m.129579 type:complete len:362 (-) Transcript_55653:162-1247(-)
MDWCIRVSNHVVTRAVAIGCTAAAAGASVKFLETHSLYGVDKVIAGYALQSSIFSSFQGVVGVMLIFRTSQAYARYMEATHLLRQTHVSLFSCLSCMAAFLQSSKADEKAIKEFHGQMVTLFSLLSATAYDCLERRNTEVVGERREELEVLGAGNLSERAVAALNATPYSVPLVFHWINHSVMHASKTVLKEVPAPVLTTLLRQLEAFMTAYEDCVKISQVHFPAPYTQTTFWLLLVHFVLTPLNLCVSVERPLLVFICTFACVFAFWAMFLLSQQMEDPFGDDEYDLDVPAMQRWANSLLLLLCSQGGQLKPTEITRSGQFGSEPSAEVLADVFKGGKWDVDVVSGSEISDGDDKAKCLL